MPPFQLRRITLSLAPLQWRRSHNEKGVWPLSTAYYSDLLMLVSSRAVAQTDNVPNVAARRSALLAASDEIMY